MIFAIFNRLLIKTYIDCLIDLRQKMLLALINIQICLLT